MSKSAGPPVEGATDDPARAGTETDPANGTDQPSGRGLPPWLPWAAGGAAILIAGVVLAVVLAGGGESPPRTQARSTAGSPGATAGGPENTTFAFGKPAVFLVRVNKHAPAPDVSTGAAAIQSSLSRLYDQAIVDRRNWLSGPPAAVWDAFAPSIRSKAKADAKAFAIGSSGRSLSELTISSSDLTIRFLVDDHGHVVSAQAGAVLRGTGEIQGGTVNLVVVGRFLFQQVSGSWLITGYPTASVNLASPSPSPQASATASPGTTP
jgi:hypothetical protein